MSAPILTIAVETVEGQHTLSFSRLRAPTVRGPVDVKCYYGFGSEDTYTVQELAYEIQRLLRITVPEITVKVAAPRQAKEEPPRLLPAEAEENDDA